MRVWTGFGEIWGVHGNHCWSNAQPPATFSAFALHSCTGSSVCTVTGTIETKGLAH